MAVKILIATPILSFGELIKATLSSHGDYQINICETGDQTLEALSSDVYDVLILDAAISGQPFAPLVQKIVASLPDLKIAVIPPENKPDHPLLETVTPHGFLFRPFLDPDLINLVQRLAATAVEDRKLHNTEKRTLASGGKEDISWTENPAYASAELSRLLLGSSALAGLVIHNGELWVHSGRISAEASQEINQMLSQVKAEKEKDLVRFTFLVADDCEALVYAVQLIAGWTLALVYDVSMPLTRVRGQATTIAAHLRAQMRLENLLDKPSKSESMPEEKIQPGVEVSESIDAPVSELEKADTPPEAGPARQETGEDQDDEDAQDILSLDDDLIALINELNFSGEVSEGADSTSRKQEREGTDRLYPEAELASGDTTSDPDEEEAPTSSDQRIGEAFMPESVVEDQAQITAEVDDFTEVSAEGEDEPAEGNLQPAEPADHSVETPETVSEEQSIAQAEAPAVEELQLINEIPPAAEVSVRAALGESVSPPEIDQENAADVREDFSDQEAEREELPSANLVDDPESGESEIPDFMHQNAVPENETRARLSPFFRRMETQEIDCQQFTLVFIPARSEQFITGELAAYLGELLKTAPEPYPWKLTGVAIRPEYLSLSIKISDFLEPSDIIHFIKEYTGTAIQKKFHLPDEAGEESKFWDDENLILPEQAIPDGTRLREFLQSVRAKAVNAV